MLAIIGGYRGLYPKLLDSITEHVSGIDRLVFVDDSGRKDTARYLRQHGEVIALDRKGYGPAMRTVCELGATDDFAWFIEEDFTFTQDVDANTLTRELEHRPHLAQIVLQRQPWFPNEAAAGSMLTPLQAKGEPFEPVDGILEHQAFFSCNPAIWRREVFATGWPTGKWSEDLKRDELLSAGYRFGITPEVMVHHDGKRTGHGY